MANTTTAATNKAWHEDARFHIFTDCDVFIEDGHYLYVENQAYNYNGDYVCCDFQQGRNLDGTMFYMQGEHSGASNKYILGFKKAPWNIARDVIERYLAIWQKHKERFEEENRLSEENGDFMDSVSIQDARDNLMRYAVEGEKFVYC